MNSMSNHYPAKSHSSEPLTLKVMTFNLRTHTANDVGNEWMHRAPWVVETIADHAPLIVGVQEADLSMLQDLQRGLPSYRWIGKGRRGGELDEYCAIGYNADELAVQEQGQFWLSETPEVVGSLGWDSDYPRICTWGRFGHLASGTMIWVYNTHFDHIGEVARIEGAKLVASTLWQHEQKYAGEAVVLMGDMNGEPSDVPLRYLRGELPEQGRVPKLQDAYERLDGERGRTFHDFAGGVEGEPIDYIFTLEPARIQRAEIDRRHFGGKYPSDHYPLIAELNV